MLQTGGIVGRLRREAAGLGLIFIKQIGKDRAHFLEAGGVEIGEIVGNHVHFGLFAFEAGANDGE